MLIRIREKRGYKLPVSANILINLLPRNWTITDRDEFLFPLFWSLPPQIIQYILTSFPSPNFFQILPHLPNFTPISPLFRKLTNTINIREKKPLEIHIQTTQKHKNTIPLSCVGHLLLNVWLIHPMKFHWLKLIFSFVSVNWDSL